MGVTGEDQKMTEGTTETAAQLPLKEQNLRVVLLNTLAAEVKRETDASRSDLLHELLRRFDEDGTTKFSVPLPGEIKPLADVILVMPSDKQDVNELEFRKWADEHRPELIKEVVIPPQEEQRYLDFDKKARADFLESLTYNTDVDAYMTADGEIVEGVAHLAGGRPKSLMVKITAANKARLLEAYRSGSLERIERGIPLQQLTDGDEVPPWERDPA